MLMKSRVLMIGAASVLALASCTKKEAPGAPATPAASAAASDAVAATVNGTPIYAATVEMMVKERTAQGQPDSPDLRKAIIENLAMQTMVAGEAVKKGLDKAPDTVRQLDILKQSILANAFVKDWVEKNPVTDAMIKAEYDKLNAKAGGSEYKARHILVATETEARHCQADQGHQGLRGTGQGKIDGSGLEGQWRRPGLVQPGRHGA
jgi:peptidyl-prolyl cis-trans isomerase C